MGSAVALRTAENTFEFETSALAQKLMVSLLTSPAQQWQDALLTSKRQLGSVLRRAAHIFLSYHLAKKAIALALEPTRHLSIWLCR